jgi:5-methylcytosine-specific restriction endonuclease McrA
MRLYDKLRGPFMEAHPLCQNCGGLSEELHHKAGRQGARLTDPDNFAALCSPCHERASTHPLWAYARGLSLHRTWDSECPTPTPGDAA